MWDLIKNKNYYYLYYYIIYLHYYILVPLKNYPWQVCEWETKCWGSETENKSIQDYCAVWQKPNLSNQGHCLLSVAMETTLSCQTETWKIRWRGDYFVMTCSPFTPQPPAIIATARAPISTGNIGKWLSEIFFGWKNYSRLPNIA